MARPKKETDMIPMDAQIEAAFWKLLKKKELNKISITELIEEAHCNRSTFYYYYTDINQLAHFVIEKTVPSDIPNIAKLYFDGDIKNIHFDDSAKKSIEKICLLLQHSNSIVVVQLIENAIIELWCKKFNLNPLALDLNLRYTLEFLAGGIVSILSRQSHALNENELVTCFKQINALFSKQAIEFINLHV